MDLDQIKEFVTLARLGNFQRTAEQLFISQSSLSKHIMSLEKELGSALLDRSKRKCGLTDFGRAFLPYAVEINDCRQRFTMELLNHAGEEGNSIAIGFVSTAFLDIISNVVQQFRLENPRCSLIVSQGSYEAVVESLHKGDISFIIVPEQKNAQGDDCVTIVSGYTDDLIVALPLSHPLAAEKVVPIKALKDEVFIRIGTSFVQNAGQRLCAEAGFKPRCNFTVRDSATAIKLISSGMGISFILKSYPGQLAAGNVAFVDIAPRMEINNVLKYLKDRKLTREEQWVVDYFSSRWQKQG